MKIKSILFALFLLPASIFGATNAFDNITVSTSEIGRGNLVWTNSVGGTVTNYFGAPNIYARKTDNVFFYLITTNGDIAASFTWDTASGAASGLKMTTGDGQAQIALDANLDLVNIMSGNYIMSASSFNIGAGVSTTFSGPLAAGSNFTVAANTTLGDAAVDTLTINASTATTPNGLNFNGGSFFTTNNGAFFGTNSFPVASGQVFMQAQLTGQPTLVLRGNPFGTATSMQQWQTAAGATGMSVSSNASSLIIGGASISAVGFNALNSGGAVSFINNTATANSQAVISGGTGAGSFVNVTSDGLNVNRGLRLARVATATNYTMTVRDHTVSFKSTTATVVTNTLPATGLFVTNGFVVRVTDGQRSALATNIVIMPNSGQTVDLTTSVTQTANGDSWLFTFDGANWESSR